MAAARAIAKIKPRLWSSSAQFSHALPIGSDGRSGMNAAVSAAEKAAILSSDSALFGPALGHALDPRTSDPDDTTSGLRYLIDTALTDLYRASDALDGASDPEAMQRVIDKLQSIGADLSGADWA
jgi:hypothetical protein